MAPAPRLAAARSRPQGTSPEIPPEDYSLPKGERLNEIITQSWNRLEKHRAAVPLLSEYSLSLEYMLLDEALGAGLVELTEVDNHGAVPNLKGHNKSPTNVLIPDGEELVGDALGYQTEFMTLDRIKWKYGPGGALADSSRSQRSLASCVNRKKSCN